MTKLKDLKIYIIDRNLRKVLELEEAFMGIDNIFPCYADITEFYPQHKDEIDCLVSPANAFGYMTGGYDAALSDILGWDSQYKVRKYIKDHYYGEQPVGSSFIIDTDIEGLKLIHTPTMQYPSIIKDYMVVYQCMRTTLMCALENDVKCIVIPVFGGACGGVPGDVAAKKMKEAYLQIKNRKGPDYNI